MRILTLPGAYPAARPAAVAIGFFDGVHLAHRALLAETCAVARANGWDFTVFTFAANAALKPDAPRLTDDETRLSLFAALGADTVCLCDFPSVAGLTPADFVRDVLLDTLHTRAAVVGYDFRFGKGAAGDAALLSRLLIPAADCRILPPFLFDGAPLSSTRIRRFLADADISAASRALGRDVSLCGTVGHGLSLASAHGSPTVNLPLRGAAALLPYGVYRSATLANGKWYSSVTDLGVCPTVGDRAPHAETHLFDFHGDLYGEDVTVYPLALLRPERKFPTESALFAQIALDIETAKTQNGETPWQA